MSLGVSAAEAAISMAVTFAALLAMGRVLSSGVRATPSGLVVRELTRTTLVPWERVRSVVCRRTNRRRVHAPVLVMRPAQAVKGARRGRGAEEVLELRILGSYRQATAQRRADEIADAHRTARTR